MEGEPMNDVPISVDGRGATGLVMGLSDIVENRNKEIAELKEKHRAVLKEIRKALDTIMIFSADSLKDHRRACGEINDILEENGF